MFNLAASVGNRNSYKRNIERVGMGIKIAAYVAVVTIVLTLAERANATIHYVNPGQSIQSAINNAINNDTIIVSPGTYFENINFIGKNITLISTDPNDEDIVKATIIDGRGLGTVVTFNGTESEKCFLTGFTITNGHSSFLGGGIRGYGTHATISHCIITNNIADAEGGGVNYCQGEISDCIISNNTSRDYGGGLCRFDGTVRNCIIRNNSSNEGGGISACGQIINCTIVSNHATANGGGLYENYGGGVTNCIIWGNFPDQISRPVYPTIYSCVQNGFAGIGNISSDPCFVDTNNNDYHLKSAGWRWDKTSNQWTWDDATSRCIDAGNPGYPLGDEPMTLLVDPLNRFGVNKRIDMGCYGGAAEASMPPYGWALLADLDNNGIVNFADFAKLANDWLSAKENQPGDLNRSGLIDLNDIVLFADNWLLKTTWRE